MVVFECESQTCKPLPCQIISDDLLCKAGRGWQERSPYRSAVKLGIFLFLTRENKASWERGIYFGLSFPENVHVFSE